MSDLDLLIKKTLSRASPHSKKVFSQSPMTGQELLDLANGSGLRMAATTRPDGRPHLSITDVIVADGKLYIGVDPAAARYTNLRNNASITMMMAEGWKRQAILKGEALFLDTKSPVAEEVLDAQKKRYGWASEVLAEIVPSRIFTWKAPRRTSSPASNPTLLSRKRNSPKTAPKPHHPKTSTILSVKIAQSRLTKTPGTAPRPRKQAKTTQNTNLETRPPLPPRPQNSDTGQKQPETFTKRTVSPRKPQLSS